jgi:hypothetical protein
MIWLGLLLVAVVIWEALHRERLIGLGMVLASLGFVISLNLLNVDAFIVKQNIQREIRSTTDQAFNRGRADLDTQYFLDLSEDAIPPLVSAFQSKDLPDSVREKLGTALACKYDQYQQDTRTDSWQSFHFSRWNAEKGFEEVKGELSSYKILSKDWPFKVETPSGEQLPCYPNYSD